MELLQRASITPFLRILIPFVCGILFAPLVRIPTLAVVLITLAVYITGWLIRGRRYSTWYILATIFLTSLSIRLISEPHHIVPNGSRLYVAAEISSTPNTSGRWSRTTANVRYFRGENSPKWVETSEKIELYIDTCYIVKYGDQLTIRGYLNPIDTTGGSYGRLMKSRGMTSRMYATPGSIKAAMSPKDRGVNHLLALFKESFAARIDHLALNPQPKAMVSTLVTGNTKGVSRTLMESYSKAGVIHIMSVSGLHMGFVLVIANLLFFWVVYLPKGHIWKNIAVIISLWIYGAAAGFEPSVIRSAFMLSLAQISLATSSRATGYNTLFAAATVMLAINPSYLYDISFQLSFIAVLSIMFFYTRLYRRKFHKNRFSDAIISSLLISVAAQLGTIPLVAYNFGRIPLLSVAINPLIVVTSFVIVALTLLWVVAPLGVLNPVISSVIEWIVGIQNFLVRSAAQIPGGSAENISFGAYTAVGLYLLLLGVMVFIKWRESDAGGRSAV